MRIIHDIHGPCQCVAPEIRPYLSPKEPVATGAYAHELLIAVPAFGFHGEENLYLSGDLAALHNALTVALQQVEVAAALKVASGELSRDWKEHGGQSLQKIRDVLNRTHAKETI